MTKFAGPTSVSSSHNYLPDNSLPPSLPTDELDYGAIIANIPLPQDLDLSGEVVKVDAFSFESGKVAEISLGSMVRSQDTKEQKVAIKIFRRIHIDRNMLEKTVRDLYDEAREWTRLEHPNVLPFFGIALDLGPSPALIAPFCNSGRIMRYLTDVPNSPQERLAFAFGIAQGLAYLHAQGLVHGNLTTKKVLINDAGFPVICGYGLANVSGQLSENTVISPSARFTAPEYFIDESTQNHAALKTTAGDVYSLSMVILEIISGLRPYHDLHNELSVVLHILPGGRPSRSELDPLLVSDRFWGFLKHLWSHHPALRPDMNRVLLGLQSLSQSGSEKPEGGQAESGPFVFESNAEDSEREEEVSFGHPYLAEINSHDLKGRLFRTDEYPFTAGGNSNIYRGQLLHRNGFKIQVAIKFIRVSNDGSGELKELIRRLKRETKVWSQLNHRNLLPFLGVWDAPIAQYPALISPFYKYGDLRQYLSNYPTADKERMILGVAYGLEYLHGKGIVHGDLKVHNVLVDKHRTPCICDFGISKIINSSGFTTSSVGTAPYMAPELFVVLEEIGTGAFHQASTTMSSDIYSFGLLVLEILTTNLIHRPTQPVLTAKAHSSLRPKRSDYDMECVTTAFWNLLNSCWEPDPDLRPTIVDVIIQLPFDTSEPRIVRQFSKFPAFKPAVEALCTIIHDCQMLTQNRNAAGQLANRCHRLLLELLEEYTDDPRMQQIVQSATVCLLHIHATLNGWTKEMTSRIQAIVKQPKVGKAIESCHSLLANCSVAYPWMISHRLIDYEDTHFHSNNEKDNEEVLTFLAAIQNAQIIGQEILTAQKKDIIELMSMMQTFLGITFRGRVHSGLSSNLYELQFQNHTLLADFNLRSGEVVRIGEFPVSGTGAMDIYEGLYLQREKVAIKVVRAINSSDISLREISLRRFYRECEIWREVWRIDQGKHVLPFYGFCQEDGPFPYIVSPWQPNGTALTYVKNHPEIDYIQLINGIALGIEVLHTMSPPVVHGEIQASNILIDGHGNPLISDFGMARIIEDITGIPFSQSRGVDDSYRWFAPEVTIGQGVLSLSADVYSYGMTILELITHEPPYNDIKHTTEVVIRSAKGETPRRPTEPQVVQRGLDDELWFLLMHCWATAPLERPTIKETLSMLPIQKRE